MAATDQQQDDASKSKGSKLALILSCLLCITGAGGGFFAVSNGLVSIGPLAAEPSAASKKAEPRPDIAFVTIPPIIVTLPPEAENNHLRFSGQIEVPAEYQSDVEFLMPRIQDFMNGYLRALKAHDIEGTGAIFRIRLQLFRRILSVVGDEKANGLLITEFILK